MNIHLHRIFYDLVIIDQPAVAHVTRHFDRLTFNLRADLKYIGELSNL